MHGSTGHSEIRIENLRIPAAQHARRARPGPPPRPVPPRPGAPGALHALDRAGRDGARHDGRPLAEALRARLAARREAGHPVDDRRLDDGAVPGEADGPARRLPHRQRSSTSSPRSRWRSTSSPTRSAASSTARSRCTARSATRPTRRSRTCTSTRAGRASPTAPDEVHQMRIAQRTIAAYTQGRQHAARRPATCRSSRRLPGVDAGAFASPPWMRRRRSPEPADDPVARVGGSITRRSRGARPC